MDDKGAPERDRTILRLAIPALGALAVEPLYVLVDTGIVGHLGTTPLGGLALASTVLNATFLVFNFLAYGTTARVAFLTGRDDRKGAAGIAAQGLWLSLICGLALIGVVALGARPLAAALGGSGGVIDAAVTYLRISALGAPFVLVSLVGHGYLRGVQDTRTPLRIVLGANVANVVIEVLFVYGLDLGVAGSAWGTVIAQVGAAACFLAVLGPRIAAAGANRGFDRAEIVRLVRFGRHLLIRTASLLGALSLSTAVAARVGKTTLGGHQIAIQVMLFLALTVDALAIAAQTLTGTYLGQGRPDQARASARRALRLGLVAGAALATALVATAGVFPHAFTGDPAVVDRARVALLFVGALQVPASVVFVLDGVLIGASDTRFQQWANVAALVTFLPFAAAVLHWHRLGIVGIWVGMSAWMSARLIANVTRFAGAGWVESARA